MPMTGFVAPCSMYLHTIRKLCRYFNQENVCTRSILPEIPKITDVSHPLSFDCLATMRWHEACDAPARAPPIGRSGKTGGDRPPQGASNGFWQDFTTAPVAGNCGADTGLDARHAPSRRRGYHDRLHLCRFARRLRL